MGLETATYLDELVVTNPTGTDGKSQGDDHLRLIKSVLKTSFPGITRAFTLTRSAEYNDSLETKSADYTIVAGDHGKILIMDAAAAARAFTLPDPATDAPAGWATYLSRSDKTFSNALTVNRSGAATINGQTSFTIDGQYDTVFLRSDGTNWHAIYMPYAVGAGWVRDTLVVRSDDAGATAGPTIVLDRNSASPAVNDLLGRLLFRAENAAAEDVDGAALLAKLLDATDGSEDLALVWQTIVAGTLADRLELAAGLYAASVAGGDKGEGSANFKSLYGSGAFLFPNMTFGCAVSNGTDAEHDIDIAVGSTANNGNTELIPVSSATTIAIDNASHRVDSSTLDPDTWYHILVGLDSGAEVAGFSKALSLPSGWDDFGRLTTIRTDGSSNILALTNIGKFMLLSAPLLVHNLAVGTSASLISVGPPDVRTKSRITVQKTASANTSCYISTPDQADTAAALLTGVATQGNLPADAGAGVEFNRWAQTAEIITDTSGQIRARQDSSAVLRMNLLGWEELSI